MEQHAFLFNSAFRLWRTKPTSFLLMGPVLRRFGSTEIVIIGQDLDNSTSEQELDACLVPFHLLGASWEEGYMDPGRLNGQRPLS